MKKKSKMELSIITVAVAGTVGYLAGKKYKERIHKRKVHATEAKATKVGEVSNAPKNALIVASVASMIDQFNIPNIKLLIEMGYNVDVATNFKNGSTCSDEKVQELIETLDEMGVDCYHIDFDRNVVDIRADIKSFQQLNTVVCGLAEPINSTRHHRITPRGDYAYDLIHSHSPIGGVVGRIVGKRHGIKNIYTAHGFHFYDGAPIKNWLIYYPIEKVLSKWTDVLITINKEDYRRAKKKFRIKKTFYVPGVGIDTSKFTANVVDREIKRGELGIANDDFVIISVGELNNNKNHQVIIKAIKNMSNVKYVIVGKGVLEERLEFLSAKLGISDRVKIIGFRTDIEELLQMSDCFAFPSKREGLGLAAIEAMSAGLPLVTSRSGGIKDYSIDGKSGYSCDANDIQAFAGNIQRLIIEKKSDIKRWNAYKKYNKEIAKRFDLSICSQRMQKVYENVL